MNHSKREEIALQRFNLIAPIVKYDVVNLAWGEKYKILRAVADGKYEGVSLPQGEKIGLRTLERYLELYETGGLEALKPKQRQRSARIATEYLEAACELKRENLQRSIETIITMLEQSGRVPKDTLKKTTVYDYFSKKQLTRPTLGSKTGRYTRYGATHRGEILQGDVHYTFKLPDPSRPGCERQVYLFAWLDDFSRLVYGVFYWKENRPSLEDSLKKWIILHGVPENIYVDNGAVYSSHHLNNICASLGIQLLHSRPYKPQGKGKIEKFFQFVEGSFKSELELLIKTGKITNLEQANQLFSIWLSRIYNSKIHSATKLAPKNKWESCGYPLKKPSLETIYEAFLWKDTRKASKTGIIEIETNLYEVEPFLCNKSLIVKYDPYDLTIGIRVYFENKQYSNAIPSVIHRHSKKGFDTDVLKPEPPPSSGINFLEQLSDVNLSKKEQLSFSALSQVKGQGES